MLALDFPCRRDPAWASSVYKSKEPEALPTALIIQLLFNCDWVIGPPAFDKTFERTRSFDFWSSYRRFPLLRSDSADSCTS